MFKCSIPGPRYLPRACFHPSVAGDRTSTRPMRLTIDFELCRACPSLPEPVGTIALMGRRSLAGCPLSDARETSASRWIRFARCYGFQATVAVTALGSIALPASICWRWIVSWPISLQCAGRKTRNYAEWLAARSAEIPRFLQRVRHSLGLGIRSRSSDRIRDCYRAANREHQTQIAGFPLNNSSV
ncbi:MAG: hypothetical protein K0R64_1431 [Novosphingobium lindaniclasticum]|nr:hypothetical protein [Novosphingobium lindaniclasticum]